MTIDAKKSARSRRDLLLGVSASVAAGALGIGAGALARGRRSDDAPSYGAVEDTPVEDLMREHAVLERVLVVYEQSEARLLSGGAVRYDVIAAAAGIVRRYVEDHHERDEEQHVFPRLASIGAETELVATLVAQHEAGRRLTSAILRLAAAPAGDGSPERPRLAECLRRFVRMYRPHAARENTVLFPAFRRAVSREEYARLQARLERDERALFGADLYERVLREVVDLERAVGVDALAAFTPPDDG